MHLAGHLCPLAEGPKGSTIPWGSCFDNPSDFFNLRLVQSFSPLDGRLVPLSWIHLLRGPVQPSLSYPIYFKEASLERGATLASVKGMGLYPLSNEKPDPSRDLLYTLTQVGSTLSSSSRTNG